MDSCVIKDKKFNTLQRRTGIDEKSLSVFVATSIDTKGRMPEIDEIFMSDSLPSMVNDFDMKGYTNGRFTVKSSTISLDSPEKQSDINSRLNNTYKDYETRVLFNGENSIIVPTKRPIDSSLINVDEPVKQYFNREVKKASSSMMLSSMIAKANNLYGMNIISFNADNEHEMPFFNETFYTGGKSALIYNGNIYINTDIADIDAPIHEMMHILLGEMKYNDSKLYYNMVSQARYFPVWGYMRNSELNDMTMDDALEEVFVQEVSRYMAGLDNSISRMRLNEKSKLEYNIMRMLDTMVFGVKSVRTVGFNSLANISLSDLCNMMGSAISTMRDKGDMSGSMQHRMLANMKTDLIKKGLLKEICD